MTNQPVDELVQTSTQKTAISGGGSPLGRRRRLVVTSVAVVVGLVVLGLAGYYFWNVSKLASQEAASFKQYGVCSSGLLGKAREAMDANDTDRLGEVVVEITAQAYSTDPNCLFVLNDYGFRAGLVDPARVDRFNELYRVESGLDPVLKISNDDVVESKRQWQELADERRNDPPEQSSDCNGAVCTITDIPAEPGESKNE